MAKVVETSILLARSLRRVQTDAERLLWRHLQSKQMEGFKFRRQAPIGKYVVDFVSFARKLIVEVDGGQHAVEIAKDQKRENWLFTQGFTTVRFWNNAVLQNLEGVLEAIRESILKI
ncbi:MAG: endonuclease domain-containing protein [Desulfobaccales bacterium]